MMAMHSMVTPMMQVVGVCTDSHVTVRTMLMNSASLKVAILTIIDILIDIIMSLKGIKFPIFCDRDGNFSRAFGATPQRYFFLGSTRYYTIFCNLIRLSHDISDIL